MANIKKVIGYPTGAASLVGAGIGVGYALFDDQSDSELDKVKLELKQEKEEHVKTKDELGFTKNQLEKAHGEIKSRDSRIRELEKENMVLLVEAAELPKTEEALLKSKQEHRQAANEHTKTSEALIKVQNEKEQSTINGCYNNVTFDEIKKHEATDNGFSEFIKYGWTVSHSRATISELFKRPDYKTIPVIKGQMCKEYLVITRKI